MVQGPIDREVPGRTLEVDLDADNPGQWALHCHNVYHAEGGMMTVLGYQASDPYRTILMLNIGVPSAPQRRSQTGRII